jgi:hypothetical protein
MRFREADLTDAGMDGMDLPNPMGANLSEVKGLTSEQLASCNMTNIPSCPDNLVTMPAW